uniref:Uncharacterized protein n=1 Tax=Hemiselmis andersenii TaxID=464988 RepID=A0A7S1E1K3_HEMAN|mmetsp:Transcript_34009/g.82861  ORF Transcript_34009/g.82861 Transcript_34009/m.82861 type:complete len:459 (+) Transcript_34009:1-1377(+)
MVLRLWASLGRVFAEGRRFGVCGEAARQLERHVGSVVGSGGWIQKLCGSRISPTVGKGGGPPHSRGVEALGWLGCVMGSNVLVRSVGSSSGSGIAARGRGVAPLIGVGRGLSVKADKTTPSTCWVRLVAADGTWSSATRLMCPPGCLVFDIDAVKKAAKAEFADELAGVSAAKLDVTVGDGGNVLEEDLLVSGLPNGKTKADPLLIHAPKPVTLTVYTRTGKDRKVVHNSTITFATNEKFEKFVATRDIWHMKRAKGRADERLSAITSLAEAVSASQQDGTFLLLDNPADELREDVSALKGGEKNRATGLEQQTTKALVSDATFQREFGNLSLVNGGEPVEIKVAGDSNVAFEVDGLVRNGWQLLLNSAKGTPTEGDVTEVRDTASRLREVLQNPSNYETLPESALSEFEGLREVVPVLSGYCFADSVKQVAESRGVRWVHTDGKGFAVEARVSKQSA